MVYTCQNFRLPYRWDGLTVITLLIIVSKQPSQIYSWFLNRSQSLALQVCLLLISSPCFSWFIRKKEVCTVTGCAMCVCWVLVMLFGVDYVCGYCHNYSFCFSSAPAPSPFQFLIWFWTNDSLYMAIIVKRIVLTAADALQKSPLSIKSNDLPTSSAIKVKSSKCKRSCSLKLYDRCHLLEGDTDIMMLTIITPSSPHSRLPHSFLITMSKPSKLEILPFKMIKNWSVSDAAPYTKQNQCSTSSRGINCCHSSKHFTICRTGPSITHAPLDFEQTRLKRSKRLHLHRRHSRLQHGLPRRSRHAQLLRRRRRLWPLHAAGSQPRCGFVCSGQPWRLRLESTLYLVRAEAGCVVRERSLHELKRTQCGINN